MEPIRVLVVDDHVLFRRGIASALEDEASIKIVGEAPDGLKAIEKAVEIVPDVILMDLNMPNCTGLEATQALQTKMPQVNI
ncbi:MAG: response regulator transcription factor, partial [Chloroflexota bacterium]